MSLRIVLVGATGLVGTALMARTAMRQDMRLIAVARREASLPPGARMEMLVAPVADWPEAIARANADVMVCALGTTIRKAGSQEAFAAVDKDLVLASARAARDAGIGHFIAVSSVGANPAARGFYLRVKGEAEAELARIGFRRLDVLRPSLLLGKRGESRPLERLGMVLAPVFAPLLHGKHRAYRPISAEQVAEAIAALAREKAAGRFFHDYDAMQRAIRRAGD